MKKITDEMVKEAVKDGFLEEDARRGYSIFTSDYGNGATHIERIDIMEVFESDAEAAEQAEKDGIKIIHDIELPEEHIAAYIDTPENRELLKELSELEQVIKKMRPLAEKYLVDNHIKASISDFTLCGFEYMTEDGNCCFVKYRECA